MLYAVYTVTCIHESDFTADRKYIVQTQRANLEKINMLRQTCKTIFILPTKWMHTKDDTKRKENLMIF